jgi:hypothetical protein
MISSELDKLKEEANLIHQERVKLEEDKNSLLSYVEECLKEKEEMVKEIDEHKENTNAL